VFFELTCLLDMRGASGFARMRAGFPRPESSFNIDNNSGAEQAF